VSTSSVTATRIGESARRSRTFGEGRVCREPTCDTVLSRYNSGAFCSAHEHGHHIRTRGVARPRRDGSGDDSIG
jgi:hypothetical protein